MKSRSLLRVLNLSVTAQQLLITHHSLLIILAGARLRVITQHLLITHHFLSEDRLWTFDLGPWTPILSTRDADALPHQTLNIDRIAVRLRLTNELGIDLEDAQLHRFFDRQVG